MLSDCANEVSPRGLGGLLVRAKHFKFKADLIMECVDWVRVAWAVGTCIFGSVAVYSFLNVLATVGLQKK